MNKVIVSPSLLSFDFSCIGQEAKMLEDSGAPWLHCDVMDGVFVPNITFGIKFVADLKKVVSKAKLDVHLMIVNPEKYIEKFALSGADVITIHLEATNDVISCLKLIRTQGAKAGLSIKPDTPVSEIEQYLPFCDLVLIMSVYPGFGGQRFIEQSLVRIEQTKKIIGERDIILQVDGGIDLTNFQDVVSAGANCIVAGSAIYKATDRAKAICLMSGNCQCNIRTEIVKPRDKIKNRID